MAGWLAGRCTEWCKSQKKIAEKEKERERVCGEERVTFAHPTFSFLFLKMFTRVDTRAFVTFLIIVVASFFFQAAG